MADVSLILRVLVIAGVNGNFRALINSDPDEKNVYVPVDFDNHRNSGSKY